MARADEEKELLRICVNELQRLYDNIDDSFNHVRTKALALLAGEVAIVAFLFSVDGSGSGRSFFEDGAPFYGVALYVLGVALLGIAFVSFLYVVSSVHWTHPPELKDLKDIRKRFHSNSVEFLEYLKSEYSDAINHCIRKCNARSKGFMLGAYTLVFGILIMLLLKYGRSIVKL